MNRVRVITRELIQPIRSSIVALVACSNFQDLARTCVGRALATRKRNAGVVLCEVEIHEAVGCGSVVLDEGVVARGSGGGGPAGAVGGGEPAAWRYGWAAGSLKPEFVEEIGEAESLD